jgi:Uma2 family endonuclease
MIDLALLTAESFEDSLYDMPEGGQWVELIRGRVETLSPPQDEHRVVVFNLSKAFGEYVTRTTEGYACFDIGLVASRDPDTVRFPAISYFLGGEMFAEADHVITETRPALVVEVMSSNDRRRTLNDRIYDYSMWGVEVLWAVDPIDKAVHIIRPGYTNKSLRDDEALCGSLTWRHKATGQAILPEFRMPVADVFAVPESWQ